MDHKTFHQMYDFSGQTAAVTGGAGILCAAMCRVLASLGANIAVVDVAPQPAEMLAAELCASGARALAVECDVLQRASLESAARKTLAAFGRIDILINGAGGNKPQATTNPENTFFDLPAEALRWVVDLNLMGTILSSQVFGNVMADQKSGSILNIASMNAFRPLTRIPAYSAAKAAVMNFTQWLAVHMAQEYSTAIRVNAIAPGFFRTEQNQFLLSDEVTGQLTARGRSILDHTPMGRFGAPDDLLGAALWLISPAASFVTGVVIPIDGGFSAYSGV